MNTLASRYTRRRQLDAGHRTADIQYRCFPAESYTPDSVDCHLVSRSFLASSYENVYDCDALSQCLY